MSHYFLKTLNYFVYIQYMTDHSSPFKKASFYIAAIIRYVPKTSSNKRGWLMFHVDKDEFLKERVLFSLRCR